MIFFNWTIQRWRSCKSSNPTYEPQHDKTCKMSVRPAKTRVSLGICPVWSVFSVRLKKPWVLSYPMSTSRCPCWSMSSPRAVTLLVLSCCGSYLFHFINPVPWKILEHCSNSYLEIWHVLMHEKRKSYLYTKQNYSSKFFCLTMLEWDTNLLKRPMKDCTICSVSGTPICTLRDWKRVRKNVIKQSTTSAREIAFI